MRYKFISRLDGGFASPADQQLKFVVYFDEIHLATFELVLPYKITHDPLGLESLISDCGSRTRLQVVQRDCKSSRGACDDDLPRLGVRLRVRVWIFATLGPPPGPRQIFVIAPFGDLGSASGSNCLADATRGPPTGPAFS